MTDHKEWPPRLSRDDRIDNWIGLLLISANIVSLFLVAMLILKFLYYGDILDVVFAFLLLIIAPQGIRKADKVIFSTRNANDGVKQAGDKT